MEHRHLRHDAAASPMLVALDDVVERGKLGDWIRLGRTVKDVPSVRRQLQDLVHRTALTSERPDRPGFWIGFCAYLDRAETDPG